MRKSISPKYTASFWKLFKILSYEILEAKFGFASNLSLTTSFRVASGRKVNFMNFVELLR